MEYLPVPLAEDAQLGGLYCTYRRMHFRGKMYVFDGNGLTKLEYEIIYKYCLILFC